MNQVNKHVLERKLARIKECGTKKKERENINYILNEK